MKGFARSAALGVAVSVLVMLVLSGVLVLLDRRPGAGWSTVLVGVSVGVASFVAVGEDVRDALRHRRDR